MNMERAITDKKSLTNEKSRHGGFDSQRPGIEFTLKSGDDGHSLNMAGRETLVGGWHPIRNLGNACRGRVLTARATTRVIYFLLRGRYFLPTYLLKILRLRLKEAKRCVVGAEISTE
jgi:hypothetical protein